MKERTTQRVCDLTGEKLFVFKMRALHLTKCTRTLLGFLSLTQRD